MENEIAEKQRGIPESKQEEPQRMHGCLKGCLIFVGVFLLISVLTVSFIYYKREAVTRWIVDKMFTTMEEEFMGKLEDDVDKGRVKETLSRLKKEIVEGDVSKDDMEKLRVEFEKIVEDEKIDSEEINHLMDAIEDILKEKTAKHKVSAVFLNHPV